MPDAPIGRSAPPAVEVECEHCGNAFRVERPRTRKVVCPACGIRTLVPLQRAPTWWLAVFGAALLAVIVPGLAYRLLGPAIAAVVAAVTLGAVWLLGRRL